MTSALSPNDIRAPLGEERTRASRLERAERYRSWRVVKAMAKQRGTLACSIFIALLIVVALAGPLLSNFDPNTLNAGGAGPNEPPSRANWLGTDALGRDTASRLIAGTRLVLRDSFIVALLAVLIAVPIGLIAGYFQGWRDSTLMRLLDATYSIPPIVLVLAVAQVADQSLPWLLLAIAVAFVPTLSRLVRSETMRLREELFVEASRGIGTPTHRIMLRRVMPNALPPVVVQSTIIMSQAIFMQATLAILAVGYPVGSPAWGSMLNDAYKTIYANPWGIVYPGLAIALTVLSFNAIGDGLRDALGLNSQHVYGRRVRLGLTEAMSHAASPRTRARSRQSERPVESQGTLPLLDIRNLKVEVRTEQGMVTAVEDFSLQVAPGEAVGLVGESGSGKTLTSLSIMRLLQSPPFNIEGQVKLNGVDLLQLSLAEMRRVRGREMGMIFQDPMSALNPAQSVGKQIAESVLLHDDVSRRVARERAVEMLARVGISDPLRRADAYPHEFSGGMRQRAMIAIALACSPKLLIADEPTTALDVTVQAQILELLKGLQDELGLAVLFVTHDLGVIAEFCDRAVVMYAGQIVEADRTRSLFEGASHPYTEALLSARSGIEEASGKFEGISGQVPLLGEMPFGCRFAPRCSYATEECTAKPVELEARVDASVRCIRPLTLEGVER